VTPPEDTTRTLPHRLRERIRDAGPVTFAGFMEAALYDPDDGFFARGAVGERGDFVTSPHVSPAFGVLVSRQVEEFWTSMEKPDPFHVVELGAGDGTLAGQVIDFCGPALREAMRYVAVERVESARRAIDRDDVSVVADIADVPRDLSGCVMANEVLDNVPFHRVRATADGLVELHVDVAPGGDGFALVEGPLSPEAARAEDLPEDLAPGQEAVLSPGAAGLVERATSVLRRGYVWIVDYGFTGGTRAAMPHGYRSHRLEVDVLADPGSRDITAGVDFDALARGARNAGHRVWGPVSQREALLALGYRRLDQDARDRQVAAAAAGRGLEANRIFSARSRASLLVDPHALGGFLVLCIGVDVEVPPTSARTVG
jgi:SAM-dependent MidA family methyltransferase